MKRDQSVFNGTASALTAVANCPWSFVRKASCLKVGAVKQDFISGFISGGFNAGQSFKTGYDSSLFATFYVNSLCKERSQ